jgi:hypothetical protein
MLDQPPVQLNPTGRACGDQIRAVVDDRSHSLLQGFRQIKDPHVVSVSALHYWTDQKIRVHSPSRT